MDQNENRYRVKRAHLLFYLLYVVSFLAISYSLSYLYYIGGEVVQSHKFWRKNFFFWSNKIRGVIINTRCGSSTAVLVVVMGIRVVLLGRSLDRMFGCCAGDAYMVDWGMLPESLVWDLAWIRVLDRASFKSETRIQVSFGCGYGFGLFSISNSC